MTDRPVSAPTEPFRPEPAPPPPAPAASSARPPSASAPSSFPAASGPQTSPAGAPAPGSVSAPGTPSLPGTPISHPHAGLPPAPPRQSFFGPQWSGPPPADPRVVLAALAAGLVAAVAMPWDAPGLGWLVAGLVPAVAVTMVSTSRWRSTRPVVVLEHAAWGVAVVCLVAVGAVRAAGWLFVLCLLAATACVPMALTTGRSVRGLFLGAAVLPLAAVRALPWVLRGRRRRERGPDKARRTAAVIAVSAGLVLIFGALLAGADPIFARTIDLVLPTVDGVNLLRWITGFGGGFLVTVGLCFLAGGPPDFDDADRPVPRAWRRIEWALPVGAIAALFALFVVVQATVLFGGGGYVQRTADVSYAEYARGGFWQLSVVTVLTLLVIAVAAYRASRETRADRAWLRGLLATLAVLTLVIVASALSRMWAYETAYGFTRLRLLVSVCELWLGLLFLLVLAAGIRLRRRATWLPRAVIAAAVVALLGIVALDPDAFIAQQNVRRYHSSGVLDVDYLAGLSADAVPALTELPEPLRSCALAGLAAELARGDRDAWQHANLARTRAREILAATPIGRCAPVR